MSRPLVWVFDAHYQIFRAYYSMPSLEAPDGTPVGAVRGYAGVLMKFLREHEPTHLLAAFDFALTSFRNELYADYKQGRTEPPPDLAPQFELCAEMTDALGIEAYSREGFEADDVIATLVPQLVEQGADVHIVSADKDLGALVDDHVRLYDLKKQAAAGPEQIRERIGVSPAQVPDFLTLVGDAVDHIPGVPGIGPKTASRLLEAFGSIEQIPLDDPQALAARGIRGAARVAQRLAAAGEQIELARSLVRMRDDLPLDADLEKLCWRGARRAALEALCERLGAQALAARISRFEK